MAELKHIGEVEQIVEVQENDNLIGERDGRAVRIPTNKVIPEGMVKSVNGNTPDSEGNVELPTTIPSVQTAQVGQTVVVKAVDENGKPTEWEAADAGSQADWNETDETKTSFIKNRTHWAETEYSIQWNGSTDGRDVVEFPEGGYCVHIGDITDPSILIGAVCTIEMNGSKMSNEFVSSDFNRIAESIYAGESPFAVVTNDNVEFNGVIFPKAGLYYSIASGNTDLFSVTITKETVHQLDPKFIPNAGGGASYIKCSSSNYIGDGTYNFVNPNDHSVIEPATNSKVREAFCKGPVFVVGGDPDITSGNLFHMSPILNLIGSSESNISYYLKGFAGSEIQDITFSIYDN